MHPLAEQLRRHWQRINIPYQPGLPEEAIAQFEAQHNVALPPEVASFYHTISGTDDAGDENLLKVWSLNEIEPAPRKLGDRLSTPNYRDIAYGLPNADLLNIEEYFVFADFLIWSHFYAVRLSNHSPEATAVIWIQGNQHGPIANTWDGFWQRYLNDPDSVIRLQPPTA